MEVYVENREDKKGQLVLSHRKARQAKSWDRVNEALEKDEIIKGYIKCRTKGGPVHRSMFAPSATTMISLTRRWSSRS